MAATTEHHGQDERARQRDRHRAFEQAWTSVEPTLRRWLAAHRVPMSDRDDYIQEVATRALVSNAPLHSSLELLRWSTTVLRHLHLDRVRAAARVELDYELEAAVADRAASSDVPAQVAARLDLALVAEEIASWTAAQRRVLLQDDAEGTRRPSAFYVSRHRLRLRLLAIIDGLAAIWLGVTRRVEPGDADRASTAAVLLPPAALACIVSMVLLDGGHVGAGPDATRRPPAASASSTPHGAAAGTARPAHAIAASRPAPARGAMDSVSWQPPTTSSPDESRLTPPFEERVEVDGPQPAFVEVDNDHGKEPPLCLVLPAPMQDTCVDVPAG